MSSILLVAAVFASLAFGVLVAYGVCLGLFHLIRAQVRSAACRVEDMTGVAKAVEI